MNIEEWKSQIKRGTLEYCVLLLIAEKDRYGYEVMNELGKLPAVAARESTLYPLLRRLEKNSVLRSYWRDGAEGQPPRKYYALTANGSEYVKNIALEWENLVSTVNEIKTKPV